MNIVYKDECINKETRYLIILQQKKGISNIMVENAVFRAVTWIRFDISTCWVLCATRKTLLATKTSPDDMEDRLFVFVENFAQTLEEP